MSVFTLNEHKTMGIKIDIEYLVIWKNLNGLANDEEQEVFSKWLADSPKNQAYYQNLKTNYTKKRLEITPKELEISWNKINKAMHNRPKPKMQWRQYAAAIILPLGIALSVLYFSNREVQSIETAHQIRPGTSKAVLKLADGELVELDTKSELHIKDELGQLLGVDSMSVLTYTSGLTTQAVFNTISIPRGGEYQLVLADGTKVWLNSQSSLTYPVSFRGETREVFLTGEAYFEVTTDRLKPFIVKTNKSAVKVYGTQFNVMSYEDEALEQTTLVEGSIAVLYNNSEVLVQPGQQAQISSLSADLTLREVDTHLYTDWKNGIFRFEEMALKDVALKLARWYDVDFFFANEEVKERKITGAMKRASDFEVLMSLIEKSAEAKVVVTEKNVLIKGKY